MQRILRIVRSTVWFSVIVYFIMMLWTLLGSHGVVPFEDHRNLYYSLLFLSIGLIIVSLSILVRLTKKAGILERTRLEEIIRSSFPGFRFSGHADFPLSRVADSQLFNWVKNPEELSTFGIMEGSVGDRRLQIADIGIIETGQDHSKESIANYLPVISSLRVVSRSLLHKRVSGKSRGMAFSFRGIFVQCSLDKPIQGSTLVFPRHCSSTFYRSLENVLTKQETVHLENPDFQEAFIVYAADQVESRYILTPEIMEKMATIQKRIGKELFFSFRADRFSCAISYGDSLFSLDEGSKGEENLKQDISKRLEHLQEICAIL